MQSETSNTYLQQPSTLEPNKAETVFKVPDWFTSSEAPASLGQFLGAHAQAQACKASDDDILNPFSKERFTSQNSRPVVGTCLNRLDHEGQMSLAQHLPNPQTRMGVRVRAIESELLQLNGRLSLLRGLTHATPEVRQSMRLLEFRAQALMQKRDKIIRQLRYGVGPELKTTQQKMAQRFVMLHEAVLEHTSDATEALKARVNVLILALCKKPWFQKISRPLQVRLQVKDLTSRMATIQAGLDKQMAQPESSTETVSALVVEYDRLSMQLGALRPMPMTA